MYAITVAVDVLIKNQVHFGTFTKKRYFKRHNFNVFLKR